MAAKRERYGMISRLNDQCGRIQSATSNLGLTDSTLNMFFTDHGLIEKGPSVRVRQPRARAADARRAAWAFPRVCDVTGWPRWWICLPTVLQRAGMGENVPHCGLSLCDILVRDGSGEAVPHREFAFTQAAYLVSEESLLKQAPWPYDI